MPNTITLSAVSVVTLLLAACGGHAADMSHNGNCEQVENGKPVGWGTFDAVGEWGTLAEGYRGRGIYFTQRDFTPAKYGDRKGEPYRGCAIVQGTSNGDTGETAIAATPHPEAKYFYRQPRTFYKFSFWIKTEATEVQAYVQSWSTDNAALGDRNGRTDIATVAQTAEWTHCERTVSVPDGTRKFALLFKVSGYQKDGFKLGKVCIDEVSIEPAGIGPTADVFKRIEIPDDPAVYVGDRPLEEVLAAYRAGDKHTVSLVTATLDTADGLAEKPDEWFRGFYKSFEPRGIYTVACPIHPFKTRYYNDFEWSINEPWKLVCKHCKAEGREYYYYPNPDYPDDGNGCEPTDEVWARTHDAAWSKAHRGIPWDHWDGQTHGDSGGGKCYHFLGKYYVNASRLMIRDYAPTLALAYHYATKLFPPGSDRYSKSAAYAHKAKLILLLNSRSVLGDDYLAAAEGITPAQFQARIEQFCRPAAGKTWQYEKLPGFRPFSHTDAMWGDPRWYKDTGQHPSNLYIFPGSWDWKASIARDLLEGICRLRIAFTEQDDDIRRICQRALVSFPGDREKVAMGQTPPAFYLKRGAFEMEIHPYNLESGADNLTDATQIPRLQTGLFLRDDQIIENVARDIYYFHRNFLSQDGLGREGSPNYSSYAARTTDKLLGMKGDFDKTAAWYDPALGGLNLYRTDAYRGAASKMHYYATEDDYMMAWEDSCYLGQRSTDKLLKLERYGGGVPEKHRKHLNFHTLADGDVGISFNRSLPWPPLLLHDRRKAIMRAGYLEAPTTVSLDYTPITGHYHWPVQHLMVHACGQELASDLGYLGSAHYLQRWIPSFPAHNCLTLRKEDGDPNPTRNLRGDLRRHFAITPFCQVVDTAEYDFADWQTSGLGEGGEMSRQVILMVPSEKHQYVIDIARGRGGNTHDLYFHCHGLGFETTGISPKPIADQDQSLYDYSGWTFEAPENWGARCFQQIATAEITGPWQATWSQIDDYRGQPKGQPLIHNDVFLRLWMLDEPAAAQHSPSQLIVGTGPAQRHFRNEDFGREMKIICLRRPNTDHVDTFASVIEPYQDAPFVNSVHRLELTAGNDYSLALAVDTVHGTDYLITYGGPGDPPEVTIRDRDHVISTDADLAIVSYPKSGRPSMFFAAGSYLETDGARLHLKGPTQWHGRLVDFSDPDDTLIIETDQPFPAGKVLAGQTLIVQHDKDRSTFTILSVERLGAGRYLIRLDDQPHLMNNWLLVSGVGPDGIMFEPPPVLDSGPSYKVYGGEPGKMRMLGPLRKFSGTAIYNEWGSYMYTLNGVVTDDYKGIEPGQEIGLTRLEKGRDEVFVTNFAYIATDR
jgi:hypothetical protein